MSRTSKAVAEGKVEKNRARVAAMNNATEQVARKVRAAIEDRRESMVSDKPLNRAECLRFLTERGAAAGHSRTALADLRKAVAEAAAPEPTAVEGSGPAERVERLRLAKDEHKMLKAWAADGEKPPRPATPNLDALHAESNGTKPKGTPRPERSERYLSAMAVKKGGARGRGVKVTDEEMATYIAKVREANPNADRNQELEIAYWLERFATSRQRWNAAWDGGQVAAAS